MFEVSFIISNSWKAADAKVAAKIPSTRNDKTMIWKTFLALFMALALSASMGYAQYDCVQGDCSNGIGKLNVKNGTAYMEGQFANGVLVQGKVAFPNGDVFEGVFKNHDLVQGVKRYKNGSVLEGRFVEGVLVDGKLTHKNGASFPVKLKSMTSR